MKKININKSDISLLIRAFGYIKPYRLKFYEAFLCILSSISIGLLGPFLWGKTLTYITKGHIRYMLICISLSFLVDIFSNGIAYLQSFLFASLNQSVIVDIKNDIYKSMLHMPIKAYDDMGNGEFMSRLHGDASKVADAITNKLVNIMVDIIRGVVIGIAIFCVNIKLALIVLVTFPLSLFISNAYGKKIRDKNEELAKENDKYYDRTATDIWGIREIRGLGIEKKRFKGYCESATILKNKFIDMSLLGARANFLSNNSNNLVRYSVLVISSILVVQKELSFTLFIAFMSYFTQFSSSLLSLSRVNMNIQQIMTSLQRIFLLMDGMSYKKITHGTKKIADLKGNIEFHNVSFGYRAENEVINNVSLFIPAKQKTAFVGSSGSGKSTLFNLILEFYEPTKGRITLDNVGIQELEEKELRKYISVVRQEPFLFSISIRDNLLLTNPDATQEEIEQVCRRAYIDDYIQNLPDKYDTILGENGITLSGGQKQRIAIARVLLKKTKIILFDEATSALDNESQFYIKKVMDEISKTCTVITIAHRLSTIIESNIIYVMNNGEIVGSGTHQSLLSTNSFYRKLYKKEVDLISNNSEEAS